jgi:predicted naringenin-chalcone synthase
MNDICLASVGTAVPPFTVKQDAAFTILEEQVRGTVEASSLVFARKVFAHPSVKSRHFGVDTPQELFGEDPDKRIERFTKWAVRLSSEASLAALAAAGVAAADVSAIVVNTCTGYICPGISSYAIEQLGLDRTIPAYDLVGAGCGGALPNLELGGSLLAGRPRTAVLCVSVEICSAAFQMGDDVSLIVSNAIFGDGASACVLTDRPGGIRLLDSAALHVPEYRDDIRFVYKHGQLHNQLTAALPEVAGKVVGAFIAGFLKKNTLSVADVTHWALHAGGENVMNNVKAQLGLSEGQVRWAREVLAECGNMSSPSAVFALKKILDAGVAPGEWGILVAFGAGMSAYAQLFRKE